MTQTDKQTNRHLITDKRDKQTIKKRKTKQTKTKIKRDPRKLTIIK